MNDWGEFGAVDARVEEYAYAASYQVAKLIFERTNVVGLQAVWQGADGAEMAYQPAHGSGTAQTGVDDHPEGWQEPLDVRDQRAGANYDDPWGEGAGKRPAQGLTCHPGGRRERSQQGV